MKVPISQTCYAALEKSDFNEDFSQIEDTEYFIAQKKTIHCFSQVIGLVIYGKRDSYSTPEENRYNHLPGLARTEYIQLYHKLFIYYFIKVQKINFEVLQVAIGHHHTARTKKCYLQVVITFSKPFQKTINPTYFKLIDPTMPLINGKHLLFMKQKSRNSNSSCKYLLNFGPIYIMKKKEGEKYRPSQW